MFTVYLFFLVGDNSEPYTFEMELWDTETNTITTVANPEGYGFFRFFRPVLATYDDESIILAGSKIYGSSDGKSNEESFLSEMFLYKFGTGWINLGASPAPLTSTQQFGIFMLSNPKLAAFDSLNSC